MFKTNKCKKKKIVPFTKNIVMKEEFILILFSNFNGIITQFTIKEIRQGKIVTIIFHIFPLKIEYKDKICKIQNIREGTIHI